MTDVTEVAGQRERREVAVTPPSDWNTRSLRALVTVIREDMRTNEGSITVPAIQMLSVHRFGEWAGAQSGAIQSLALAVFRLINSAYIRNVLGFEIARTTKIGRRVRFVHQHGVVLMPNAVIGDECWIYHNVTVGRRWTDGRPDAYLEPVQVGKGVHLTVGCTVLGAVRIGDEAKIGPHAVVTSDVPAGASVVAPASRILRLH